MNCKKLALMAAASFGLILGAQAQTSLYWHFSGVNISYDNNSDTYLYNYLTGAGELFGYSDNYDPSTGYYEFVVTGVNGFFGDARTGQFGYESASGVIDVDNGGLDGPYDYFGEVNASSSPVSFFAEVSPMGNLYFQGANYFPTDPFGFEVTPEPSTLALAGVGMAGLLLAKRRKQKQ